LYPTPPTILFPSSLNQPGIHPSIVFPKGYGKDGWRDGRDGMVCGDGLQMTNFPIPLNHHKTNHNFGLTVRSEGWRREELGEG